MSSYAIIGSGISGLSAAFYLCNDKTMKDAVFRVYESSERIGGHSHTVIINGEKIDLGFQVSNPKTYPNLYTFFEQIGVRDFLVKTSMSFSVKQPNFEWGFGSAISLVSLLTSWSFYKLIFELYHFYNIANQFVSTGSDDVSIDDFVNMYKFTVDFKKYYLYPFTSCVWSIGTENVGSFSAKQTFIFMRNHGLLSFLTYQWYFLTCNCDTYIDKIKKYIGDIIKPNHNLVSISRDKNSWLLKFDNNSTAYADNIIFACRGEHVYNILQNSSGSVSNETLDIFSKLKNTSNTVSVHRDERDMPKNKTYWSSWNYTSDTDDSNYRCTYWMKELQNTNDDRLFTTMHNNDYKPNYKELLFEWTTDHPSYDMNTQKCIDYINSVSSKTSGLWFCGAYMGYGFHEDGIVSAKRVVESITDNKEYKPFASSCNIRSMLMKYVDGFAIQLLLVLFRSFIRKGNMNIWFPGYDTYTIQNDESEYVNITIQHPTQLCCSLVARSDLGMMEEIISQNIQPNSLNNFMNILTINYNSNTNKETWLTHIGKLNDLILHKLRNNTIQNSKTNISKHYDLSNELFELFLDKTMTYSSAYFNKFDANGISHIDFSQTLCDAQIAKYNRIIDKLQLTGNETILEIGCGWGGFAEVLSQRFPDTKWTGLTLSVEQAKYCNDRLRSNNNHSNVITEDYRTFVNSHKQQYDRVVSIEMIEAVGYEFLDEYFSCIQMALSDKTSFAVIQAITIPDHRIDAYRTSVDFINMYIFPGGFCPSIGNIVSSASRSKMVMDNTENFALSYSETLRRWNVDFQNNWEKIAKFGFDEHFKRVWELYFVYCEYGFKNNLIGVNQITLKQSP